MARVIFTLALVALLASSVVADVALRPPGATNSSNAQSLKEKFDSLDKMAKSVSWHKPPVPAHIVKAQAERVLAMPVVETGGCGSLVGTSHLKKSALALFQKPLSMKGGTRSQSQVLAVIRSWPTMASVNMDK